jgi:hypothetical protein
LSKTKIEEIDYSKPPPEFKVVLYGSTAKGHSVCAEVTGYQPYFYLSVDDDYSKHDLFEFETYLRDGSYRDPGYFKKYQKDCQVVGKWYKQHLVKVSLEKKKEFMSRLLTFAVKPTWIVDTRNGYQAYWIISNSDHNIGLTKNKKYWNGIQKKLANYFNADIRAMKINQIFRVPFTWWRKPWEGKKSYFCTLCSESTGNAVSMVSLQTALTGQSAQVHVKSSNSSDAWYEKIRNSKHTSSDNSVPITVECATQIITDLINKDATNPTIIGENDDIPDYINDDPESNPVMDAKCIPNEDQLKLLSSVVHFLNQVSTPLYFSNNKFLSTAARELAAKMSDEFCVG